MRIKLSLLTLLLVSLQIIHAQNENGCDGVRYLNPVFNDIEMETVFFGKNKDPQGDSVSLYMDVYYPNNDPIEKRPLIVWAHGGAFISGDKSELAEYCQLFASKGYVAATIDYRLYNFFSQGTPTEEDIINVAVQAMGDIKGAIRWFKYNAGYGNNTYQIDTNFVFAGGYSAGSIATLMASVFTENDELDSEIQAIVDANGGITGNTGNPDNLVVSSSVKAVLNLSGAVLDTSYIDEEDPMILSIHGTSDGTVQFGYGNAVVFGIPLVTLYGSQKIYEHTSMQGWPGLLYVVEGGDHVDIYTSAAFEQDLDNYIALSDSVLHEMICGPISQTKEVSFNTLEISPNPASDLIQFEAVEYGHIEFFDARGQKHLQESIHVGENQVSMKDLTPGIYFYQLTTASKRYTGSLLIE